MRALLAVLILCLAALACAGTGQVAAADLHVGPVQYLNDTSTLLRTIGPPVYRRGPSAVAGGPIDIWRWDRFQCLLVSGWRCDQLSTTDPTVEVGPGLRVGMPLDELQRRLGPPAASRRSGDTTFVIYDLKGKGRGFGLSAAATRDTVRTIAVGQLTFVFM